MSKKIKTVTGDYNEHKERFNRLMPVVRKVFMDEGLAIPEDDAYKMLDEVIERQFEGDNEPLTDDDFINMAQKIEEQLREKVRKHKAAGSSEEHIPKWQMVEDIYNKRGDITYEEAIAILNQQFRCTVYKNYASFNAARNRYKKGF